MTTESASEAEVRAAVIAASRAYFAARRARVDGFVDKWFSVRGTLRLHRHAVGWDLARAPANLGLGVAHVGTRLGAGVADLAGRRGTAKWLRERQLLLETDVMREVQRLIMVELLELPNSDAGVETDALAAAILADPEVRRLLAGATVPLAEGGDIATSLADYAGTRAAVGEMTAALATLGAGAAAFHKLTPGVLSLGPVLAVAMTQSAAVAAFPLGATAGSIWYGLFPPAASGALVVGATAGLLVSASVLAAFAGIVADPVQRGLGVHRRRLIRLIDAIEKQFVQGEAGGFAAREHYVARLMDLMDAGFTAARALRG